MKKPEPEESELKDGDQKMEDLIAEAPVENSQDVSVSVPDSMEVDDVNEEIEKKEPPKSPGWIL